MLETATCLNSAPDVFMCVANDRVVFLDLRRNRYFCMNGQDSQTLFPLLPDSIDPVGKQERPVTTGKDARRILEVLTAKGLVRSRNLETLSHVPVPNPVDSLIQNDIPSGMGLRAQDWVAFARASLAASWKLRSYTMYRIVDSVRKRKEMSHQRVARSGETGRLVSTFHRLRPFYFRKYLCLYDSLSLLEYLARYRLYPMWVFGVAAEPFNAHCWVQHDDLILNDSVERVRQYTPIMVI